jgi:hypothetical protein
MIWRREKSLVLEVIRTVDHPICSLGTMHAFLRKYSFKWILSLINTWMSPTCLSDGGKVLPADISDKFMLWN